MPGWGRCDESALSLGMEGSGVPGYGGPVFPSSYEPSILGPETPKDPSFRQERDLHVFPPGTFLMNQPLATWDLSPIPPHPPPPRLSSLPTQTPRAQPVKDPETIPFFSILIICISCSKELEEGEGHRRGDLSTRQ